MNKRINEQQSTLIRNDLYVLYTFLFVERFKSNANTEIVHQSVTKDPKTHLLSQQIIIHHRFSLWENWNNLHT